MFIRCWGARGSIPVSGAHYLIYGGDTTCLEIRTRTDEIVLVDAGTGIRRLGNLLLAENRNRYTMIFTHSHWDHLMGFPFFRPLYQNGVEVYMRGCPAVHETIRQIISRVMTSPNFPVNYDDLHAEITYNGTDDKTFTIGGMTVDTIPLSHPNGGSGYKFTEGGKTFVFLTDNELMYRHPGGLHYEDYVSFSADADLLIHDAEYTAEDYTTTRTWGHSVYTDVLRLAIEAGVAKLGLFHHNQDRTDDQINEIVSSCRKIIKNRTAAMDCFAVKQDMVLEL